MFETLEALNPDQREAVTHEGGPLLIVAGAGSGKTLTLACRVAWLVDRGVSPPRILLLTFTRRAAREMLMRAEQLTGLSSAGRVWGGTFHATANRLLRLYGRGLGLPPSFTVMDLADAEDVMNLIRGELGYGAGERRFPRKETLASIYSRTVNAQARLGEVLEAEFPWCTDEHDAIRTIFKAYTQRKREQHVLDYDDLLLFWRALATARGAGDTVAGLFDHILVDEYQDTNALQADVLEAMGRGGAQVTVVGDDAQAIYGFRSATVRNILEFPERFPGTRIVRLERNYRSTQPILDASNAVISLSPQRHEKTLWTDRASGVRPALLTCIDELDQADLVCKLLLEHRERGTPLKEQAVLFRTGHHSDLLEVELAHRNIPFVKYGGLKFVEAAHVKDVLAMLRILENPRDEVSWFRVLLLLEDVGPATAHGMIERLGVRGAGGGDSPLRRLADEPPPAPPQAAPGLDELRAALADCMDDRLKVSVQIARLRRFLDPAIRRRYEAGEARLRDLDQLERLATAHGSRSAFLAELTLDPPSSTSDLAGPPLLDEDYVVLSTIHSAKGGEWDVVHVIHAADGMIPSDMATGDEDRIEEERRLLYVALTRARDALYVHFPQRYHRRLRGQDDPHHYAQITRFLPPDVRASFEERTTMSGQDDPAPRPLAAATSAQDVDAFLRGLWDS